MRSQDEIYDQMAYYKGIDEGINRMAEFVEDKIIFEQVWKYNAEKLHLLQWVMKLRNHAELDEEETEVEDG